MMKITTRTHLFVYFNTPTKSG